MEKDEAIEHLKTGSLNTQSKFVNVRRDHLVIAIGEEATKQLTKRSKDPTSKFAEVRRDLLLVALDVDPNQTAEETNGENAQRGDDE